MNGKRARECFSTLGSRFTPKKRVSSKKRRVERTGSSAARPCGSAAEPYKQSTMARPAAVSKAIGGLMLSAGKTRAPDHRAGERALWRFYSSVEAVHDFRTQVATPDLARPFAPTACVGLGVSRRYSSRHPACAG